MMSDDELGSLVNDIRDNGLRQPIYLYKGKVLDGRNRLQACKQAGVDPRFENFTGTESEATAFVISMNLARRHLTTAQKAVLAVRLLPQEKVSAQARMLEGRSIPTQSIVEGTRGEATDLAGARVGISGETVRQATLIYQSAPDVFQAMQAGIVRTLPEARRLAEVPVKQRKRVVEQIKSGSTTLDEALGVVADRGDRKKLWVGESYEWFSPPDIVEAARRVMGDIDLDPASCEEANQVVKAAKYYTIDDDGLRQDWTGRVFLNPPYGLDPDNHQSNTGLWTARLLQAFRDGQVTEAVLLVAAGTDRIWFWQLWDFPICFFRRRLKFSYAPGAKLGKPIHGSAAIYLGPNVDEFVRQFKFGGRIVLPGSGVGRSV